MRRLLIMLLFWVGLAVGLAALPAPAGAANKIALVIGNDAYTHVPALARAVADARAYRDMLAKERGFDVVFAEDADRNTMISKVGEFLGRIRQGDVALVVYSGHGVQLDPNDGNTLYLLPTDIPSVDPGAGGAAFFLDAQAVNFARLAEQVAQNGAVLRVFVLDACRNNPFPERGGRSIGMTRGLGRVGASIGEFVFFAAAPGEMALDYLPGDDASANSVFTRVFLEHFKRGTYLEDIANDVQAEVLELSRKASYHQRPYYSDGVAGKACLDAECGVSPAAPAAVMGEALEASYWSLCERRDALSYCAAYLEKYPAGPHAPLARLRIADLKASAAAGQTPAVGGAPQPPQAPADDAGAAAVDPGATALSTDAPPRGGDAPPGPQPGPEIAAIDPGTATSSAATSNAATTAAEPPSGHGAEAAQAWGELEESWDIRTLRGFVDTYPDTAQRAEADDRIAFLHRRHAEAQAELNRLGYKAGPVDGDWGRRSARALRAFQADHGLTRTGIVEPEVLEMLKSATPRIASRSQTQPGRDTQPGSGATATRSTAAPSATTPRATTPPITTPPKTTPPKTSGQTTGSVPRVAAVQPTGSIEVVVTSEFSRSDSTCPTPKTSRPVRIELGPGARAASGSTGWLRFSVQASGEGASRRLVVRATSPHSGKGSVSFPLAKVEGGSEVKKYTRMTMPANPACGAVTLYLRKR